MKSRPFLLIYTWALLGGRELDMTILNPGVEWSRLWLNPDVRRAFRGTPVKTRIPVGSMLCRFVTTESKTKDIKGTEIFLSPWWMDWKSMAALLAKFKTASNPKDIVRAKLAVTKAFSQELDSMAQIILTRPVYAWKGIAQAQDDASRGPTFIGGGEQYFLPNLASDAKELSSSVASLHCFAAIESLE